MKKAKLCTMWITLLVVGCGCSLICPEFCPESTGAVTIPAFATVCFKGRPIVIHVSQVRCYIEQGAVEGECDG